MTVIYLAFLIGLVSGLRTFMGLAAISWAARLHWLPLGETKLAFLGYVVTPYVVSALALMELVTDQLPKTPSRTVPPQFIARLLMGSLCGAAIGAASQSLLIGLLSGIAGNVVGTLGGAKVRALLANAFGKDMPAAFLEDAVAIGLAILVVTRF